MLGWGWGLGGRLLLPDWVMLVLFSLLTRVNKESERRSGCPCCHGFRPAGCLFPLELKW